MMKNPQRARVRAETRTCGTDSPSRSKSRALSITIQYIQFEYILFELLGGRSSQPSDRLPCGEWGKVSERTLEGGASRVRVTSSDDSRVDRIACAGSPSLSRLFLRMVQWRDG